MKIAMIYFSATGNTEKIKNVIKYELIRLNNEVHDFNIANRDVRQSFNDIGSYNGLIFGFPIYYLRAPRIVREWLSTKDGNHISCATFFTYGGVHVGLAHYDIKKILDTHNFELIASAEFLAKHTYNVAGFDLMKNRPNEEDFEIAKEYANISHQKFLKSKIQRVSIETPKLSEERADKIEITFRRAIPIPYIDSELCTQCGLCEKVCVTNAMEIGNGKPRRIDCIRCLRCLFSCPENAIKVPNMTPQYQYLKNVLKLTDEKLRNRKSKIYI
jgi:ferredoxin